MTWPIRRPPISKGANRVPSLLNRQPKPDAGAYYRATESFLNPGGAIHRGEHVRGDHPALVHAFRNGASDCFLPAGEANNPADLDAATLRVRARALASVPAETLARLPQPLPPDRRMIATRGFPTLGALNGSGRVKSSMGTTQW
jgi:hypothetical protein